MLLSAQILKLCWCFAEQTGSPILESFGMTSPSPLLKFLAAWSTRLGCFCLILKSLISLELAVSMEFCVG